MNKDVSPIESGLMPFVRMKKQTDFVGKDALVERLKIPMTSTTVMLKVDTDNCDPEGDESVMMFGKAVRCSQRLQSSSPHLCLSQIGFTTSGCHSPALGSGLAMASLPISLSSPGTRLQVRQVLSPPISSSIQKTFEIWTFS